MSEYISRDLAIKAMDKLEQEDIEAYGCKIPEGFDGERARLALILIPDADVRANIHGHWLIQKHGLFMRSFWCSRCGMYSASDAFNYCPWCGADMDEKPELEDKT